MTWIHAVSYAGIGLRPENRSDLLRNAAGVLFHFASRRDRVCLRPDPDNRTSSVRGGWLERRLVSGAELRKTRACPTTIR